MRQWLVHILTAGFTSPNGRAFLFPLVAHQEYLRKMGIRWRLFTREEPALCDCDVLIVESKYFSPRWRYESAEVLESFDRFRASGAKLYYFQIGDSSTWDHARVLQYVDGYFANQLLKDRARYLRPFYGSRVYTDYYHEKFGVEDDKPVYSEPICDVGQLQKLGVGWNSGLADYSPYGPYRMALYNRLPFKSLLSFPGRFTVPDRPRKNDFSCRMGISYQRQTVAWQRQEVRRLLGSILPTDKLSRGQYFRELCDSRVVVSPFGLGEITLKDFEVFLTGGVLLKPDMSHMETWPNFFQDGHSIVTFKWNLENLQEKLREVLDDYARFIEIARFGQRQYFEYLVGPDAAALFGRHLLDILQFGENDG